MRSVRIEALKLTGSTHVDFPWPCTLELESDDDLNVFKAKNAPAVFIVLEEDLELLRRFRSAVIDRGDKHQSRTLSQILIGCQRIPLVRGGHTHAGQFLRSCRKLFEHAVEKSDGNVYFIGAEKRTLDEVRQRSDLHRASHRRSVSGKTLDFVSSKGFSYNRARTLRDLYDLLPDVHIPGALQDQFIGKSFFIDLVRRLIIQAGIHDRPVLILGETGTGKEIVARTIHQYGKQQGKVFNAINCGAMPPSLFESELFGYEKGAFTGAYMTKLGLWETAKDGTLFLDEIGELKDGQQAALLRVMHEGKIRRIGGTQEIDVHARIIAATNRDLYSMVQARKFREDLYYRLRTFLIYTPALRHHPDDIPILAQRFWADITQSKTSTLSASILDELKKYHWPGNVRELKMVLLNLDSLFKYEKIEIRHLKAVLNYEFAIPTLQPHADSGDEFCLHRIECLRHLKRVGEVLGAIEFSMETILQKRKEKKISEYPAVYQMFRSQIAELGALLVDYILFRKPDTYKLTRELYGQLRQLPTHGRKRRGSAEQERKKNLEKLFNAVKTTVMKDVEWLVERY